MAKIDTLGSVCYRSCMPAKNGRNVALTAEQNAFVERLVKSGRYASASEVVRDGLRLLQDDEQVRLVNKWLSEGLTPQEEAGLPSGLLRRAKEAIRAKIQEGLEEARRGELVDGEEFFAQWRARLQKGASPKGKPRRKRRA